jgi:hypothetical protein
LIFLAPVQSRIENGKPISLNPAMTPTALPALTPLMRLVWSLVAAGSVFGAIYKFGHISARHESLFEDMIGSRSKLPARVQMAISWQRALWEWLPWLSLVLLGLVVWIWLSKSPRAVKWVSISVAIFMIGQGLLCSAITLSYVPVVLEKLQSIGPAL